MDRLSHTSRREDAAMDLPPLAEVAAALREITEVLAHELTTPTDVPPAWSGFEWCIAQAVASMQGVASVLARGSRWRNPAAWQIFLRNQRDHVAGRHRRIVEVLARIDSDARRAGIPLVALKGAALHAAGVYQPGERPMADVDLLVREADVAATIQLLGECGFEVTFATWRNLTLEPRSGAIKSAAEFGENRDNPLKIEVHTSIRERLPISETDITGIVFPEAPRGGLNDYPTIASLMLHLLLHAAGNMRANALRLIQLHDIALLAQRFDSGDWEELLAARPGGKTLWWAYPPLRLTWRYYSKSIPEFVLNRLGSDCPWLLGKIAARRRLTDVSWSNIRVRALPGIEWSRSPAEALSFAASRVWPRREDRGELRHFAVTHPGASGVPWYGISQAARILRWIFTKPPRVQTLLSVRAALTQSPSNRFP
jgi:hypothetical protein